MTTIAEVERRAGVTLFPYQQNFLDSILDAGNPEQLRACLFYKTGAGKSLTALAAIAALGYDRCVVIAPPSTHQHWLELGETLGIRVAPLSHALFRQKTTKLSRTVPIVADEFHLFGGQRGKGWRKLDKLAQHLQAPLILASATPNYNDAERCYCVSHILDPMGTRGGYLQFVYTHCTTEQNPFGVEPIVTGFQKFSNAAEFLASLPKVYYLPDDAVFSIIEIPYKEQVPDELRQWCYNRRRHRVVASIMEMRHTLRYQGLVDEDDHLRAHVMAELLAVIQPSAAPVMVYANHATVALSAQRALVRDGVPAALVTGSTSPEEKDRILNEFRAGQHHVLIGTATLATGTDGMDKVCDTLVILDDTDDDALRRQLIGRILPRGNATAARVKHIFRMTPTS